MSRKFENNPSNQRTIDAKYKVVSNGKNDHESISRSDGDFVDREFDNEGQPEAGGRRNVNTERKIVSGDMNRETNDPGIRDYVNPEFSGGPEGRQHQEAVEKKPGFFERAKQVLNNPQIQRQFAKSMIGAIASIAGVKSIFDVPKYFYERWQVRGMFGKGKGLSGSVEELLEASWSNSKRIATQGNESTNVREAIKDLNKRLSLTREGSEKGSEQRKMLAQMLRENRKIKIEGPVASRERTDAEKKELSVDSIREALDKGESIEVSVENFGSMENDWKINRVYRESGQVVVEKMEDGKKVIRVVPLETLKQWNEKPGAEEQISKEKSEVENLEGEEMGERILDPENFSDIEKQNPEVKQKIEWAKQSGNEVALKIVAEYEQKREMSLENVRAKMTNILENYTTTKVTGMQAVRESLNTFFVASGALAMRPLGYGLMDSLERYQRLNKESRINSTEAPTFWRDVIAGSIRETYQEALLKNNGEGKSNLKKGLDFARSWGRIARYAGFGATAAYSENIGKSFDSALDMIEGKMKLSDVGHNFENNLMRSCHVSMFDGNGNLNKVPTPQEMSSHGFNEFPAKSAGQHEIPQAAESHDEKIDKIGHRHAERTDDGHEHPREKVLTSSKEVDDTRPTQYLERTETNLEYAQRRGEIDSLEKERAKIMDLMKSLESSDSPKFRINLAQEELEEVRAEMRPILDAALRGTVDEVTYQHEYIPKLGALQKQENVLLAKIEDYKREMEYSYKELGEYQRKLADVDNKLAGMHKELLNKFDANHDGEISIDETQTHTKIKETTTVETQTTRRSENGVDVEEKITRETKVEDYATDKSKAAEHVAANEKVHVSENLASAEKSKVVENVTERLDHPTNLKHGKVEFRYDSNGNVIGDRIQYKEIGMHETKNYLEGDYRAKLSGAPNDSEFFRRYRTHAQGETMAYHHLNRSVNRKLTQMMNLYEELSTQGHKKEAQVILKEAYKTMEQTERSMGGGQIFDRSRLPKL